MLSIISPNRKLKKQLKLLRIDTTVLDYVSESISIFDSKTKRLLYANSAFYDELCTTPESLQPFSSCRDLFGNEFCYCESNSCFLEKSVNSQVSLEHTSPGRKTWKKSEITYHYLENGYILRRSKDRTKESQVQDSLLRSKTYDSLTGLMNRESFLLSLKNALRLVSDECFVAVIMLDVDRFRLLNDSLGREAGDQLLRTLADRLRYQMPAEASLSRLTADEFAIVTPVLQSYPQLSQLLAKLQSSLKAPMQILNRREGISVSYGVAIGPKDSVSASDLLHFADLAVSSAKLHEPGTTKFFTSRLKEHVVSDYEFEGRLKRAFENNELRMNFQPQISISTGKICGAEALLRWKHSEHGEVSPQRLVQHAESTGFVRELDEWTFREVCRLQRHLLDSSKTTVPIAVNISGKSLLSEKFVPFIQNSLRYYQLHGSYIEIEITESVFLSDIEQVSSQLECLRREGLKVSIDDFGTGYSSLSYLKTLAIDKLKIDRCFIQDLVKKQQSYALVELILRLSSSLKLESLAEGVETAEQLSILKEKGCEVAQGFLFSKALSFSEFEDYLAASQEQFDD